MEIQKAWDLENEIEQILSQLKIADLTAKIKIYPEKKLNEWPWQNC